MVLIPKIDRFSRTGSFEEFLGDLKIKLLETELARLSEEAVSDFGYAITSSTFDLFLKCD